MFPVRNVLLRASPIVQNAQRTNVSGPPAVRMSLVEKFAHMAIMAVGFTAFPLYILSNVRKYRGKE